MKQKWTANIKAENLFCVENPQNKKYYLYTYFSYYFLSTVLDKHNWHTSITTKILA